MNSNRELMGVTGIAMAGPIGSSRRSLFGLSFGQFSVFGLGVAVGSLIGSGTIYYFLVRRKLEDVFVFQHTLSLELDSLRTEVQSLKGETKLAEPPSRSSLSKPKATASKAVANAKKVQFRGGYYTTDDEEFVTAGSSSSDPSDVEMGGGGDADDTMVRLATRVKGSENLLNGVGPLSASPKRKKRVHGESAFFQTVDQLFEGDSACQDQAFHKLQTNEDKYGESAEYWWRMAKASHLKATSAGNGGDNELKKSLTFEAFTYAEKALELNPDSSADVHKWYSITLGSKGEFVATNEKIKNGYVFKEHLDKAIIISPKDSTLHYLLGRFCFEVSLLSWIERQVASTLFAAPPTSSYEEALVHFQNADSLGKPFKDNRLYIAKCYIASKDYKTAVKWLKLAAELPTNNPTDRAAELEVQVLLGKYSSYG